MVVVTQCVGTRLPSVRHCRRMLSTPSEQLPADRPVLMLLISSDNRVVPSNEICLPPLPLPTA